MESRERVLFISDIHSNMEALVAILDEAKGTEVYCLGDVVGYGASPNEVISLLKESRVNCIAGNHDIAALTGQTGGFNARAAMALVWTRRQLTEESRSFLSSLAEERRIRLGGEEIYMTHGSPDDRLREYVHPSTHSDLFPHYLSSLSVRAVALGHTHIPFSWSGEGGGVVFNPGSVGQPRNGDSRASCAFLEASEGSLVVEHRFVTYDVDEAAGKIVEAGLPESLASRLLAGE